MNTTGRIVLMVFALILCFVLLTPASAADSVTVFAAASTTNAINDIGKLFTDKNKVRVVTSFASSSTLAKQIENGAPAEVYISANEKWMDYLEKNGLIVPSSRFDLLGNQIVLIAPADSTISVVIAPGFDLANALADGKLVMGDPDHVPAGIYGKQALENLGVWESVKSKVARAKDVRAALALVERGEAPLGVVYATDAAISDKIKVVGTFPKDSHPPIVYPAALVAGKDTPEARSFLEFLKGSEAGTVFKKYGFSMP